MGFRRQYRKDKYYENLKKNKVRLRSAFMGSRIFHNNVSLLVNPLSHCILLGLFETNKKGLKRVALWALKLYGGADETRTRDLRRDRPAF